jgi:hypothetical protein
MEMTGEAQAARASRGGRPAWSSRHPRRAALVYAVSYAAVAYAGAGLMAELSSPAALVVAVTGIAAIALALSLLLVLSLCRVRMRPAAELAWVLAMMVVFSLVRPSVLAFAGRWMGQQEAGERLAQALSVIPGPALLGNIALIVWATFLGRLVSRIVREGKLILPVAVVASLADTITVFWGVVARVTETAPEVAAAFSTATPVAVPAGVRAPILTMVGIGDFLFLALFLALTLRYSMQPVRTMWATFALMLLAPLAFLIEEAATGLPGLPFLAVAVLWANWSHFNYTREEKRALAVVGLLVAISALGVVEILRR